MSPGLAPSSSLQKAQADMICDGCMDFATKLFSPAIEKDEARKVQYELNGRCMRYHWASTIVEKRNNKYVKVKLSTCVRCSFPVVFFCVHSS